MVRKNNEPTILVTQSNMLEMLSGVESMMIV